MEIETLVKSGDHELISSGIVVADGNKALHIQLKVPNENAINLILKFENDESEKKELKRTAKAINNTTLEVLFTNYNNVFGSYSKEYWQIGTFTKRKLFFTYIISGLTDSNLKKIEYSFYLGEEVQNG